jgi:uncharacterized protein YgiM (DUF1202 family)
VQDEIAFVNVNYRINVRSGPAEGFPVVGSVGPDTPMRVLDYSTNEQWVNVLIEDEDDLEGWVARRLIRIEGEESSLDIVLGGEMMISAGASQQVAAPASNDRRWHGMTVGAIVSAVLIALGSVIGVVRGLARRRRSS